MAAHSLFRLSSRVYNVPHLITPTSLSVILDYFEARNSSDFKFEEFQAESPTVGPPAKPDEVGVLRVDGSLTYKPVMTMCGEAGTSYQSLVQQVDAMAQAGVKTIVMEVSSPGGEASHVFETANDIRAICDEHNIQLLGYADTMACSAAYALISVCDQIVANPSADVGSIGCVVALMDTSKAMAQAGLKRIFIASGDSKVPFAEDGSFKEAFLDDIQATVNELNEQFASHVSSHTGLDTKTIKGFEAKVFSAAEALKLGLINAVMTNKEFAQFVAQSNQGIQ